MRPRGLTIAFVAAAVLVAASAGGVSAQAKKKRELAGEVVDLHTTDGWTLKSQYLESREEDRLTFILLHESRGRRQNWYWLTQRMARRGIGYLAIDLRGHGQSNTPPEGQPATWREFRITKHDNPWDAMRQDISAGVEFLLEQGVPEESIAIGGARVGGSLALKYAALNPAVPMIFMLSPGMSYREILTVNAMRAFRDRPILLVVAEDDRGSSTETQILHAFARKSAGDENVTLIKTGRSHGTRMLYYNKGLTGQILDWIDNPIQLPELEVSTETFGGEGAAEPDSPVPPENGPAGSGPEPAGPPAKSRSGLPSDSDLDDILNSSQ